MDGIDPGAAGEPTGTISGTATCLVGGKPVAKANVTLFCGPRGSFRTTTDASGHYVLTGVPSGRYVLFVGARRCFLSSTRPVIHEGRTTTHHVRLDCR